MGQGGRGQGGGQGGRGQGAGGQGAGGRGQGIKVVEGEGGRGKGEGERGKNNYPNEFLVVDKNFHGEGNPRARTQNNWF